MAVDPSALKPAWKMDRALADGVRREFAVQLASGTSISGCYVPMMCERTPVSLALLLRFATMAETWLGRRVLPGRAKGVLYDGQTAWHRDTELTISGLSFLAYLEPLDAATGALRVVPNSHIDRSLIACDGHAIETRPGDVIVLVEQLLHGSQGGRKRRQWRVDFVATRRTKPRPTHCGGTSLTPTSRAGTAATTSTASRPMAGRPQL